MNILFISNDQNIFDEKSAVRARMRTYATEVAKNGGTLHILSRAPRTAEVTDGSLVLHGIAGNPISVLRRLPHIARKLIRAHSIAVVSAQDPFERGWVAYKAVHHTSAKLHIQIHTDFCSPWFVRGSFIPTIVNRIRRKLADRVLPHADGIRVVSKRIQDSLTSRYGTGLKNIAIIPIPVDATVPDLVPFPHADGFMLFTASRLEQEKRIQDLLQALATVLTMYPHTHLMIAGQGSERKRLEKLVSKLGLGKHVTFLGPRPDARGLMRSAQAYIQASAYEGYGITLIEAALAHVPIITTEVGIVGEVLAPGTAVLAVPPGDVAGLARNIRVIIESTRRRVELVMRAEQAARSHLAHVHDGPADIIADMTRLGV